MKTAKLSPARNGHSKPPPASPVAEALAEIKRDTDAREKACMEDMNALLKRHNCGIHVVPHVAINGQPAGVLIKANPAV